MECGHKNMKIGSTYNKLFTKEEFYTLDYNDLDQIIKDFFGVSNYEYVALEKLSNYSERTYNIKKEPLDEYNQKRYEEFLEKDGCKHYITNNLLQILVNNDAIPEGNILVKVSW